MTPQEKKWAKLRAIPTIEERRAVIERDLHLQRKQYKAIAQAEPLLFFELLGGDLDDVGEFENWAPTYSFQDAVSDGMIEWDWDELGDPPETHPDYDEEKESIKHADEIWFHYKIGRIQLECPNGEYLHFGCSYSEGYFEEMFNTPYDEKGAGFGYFVEGY